MRRFYTDFKRNFCPSRENRSVGSHYPVRLGRERSLLADRWLVYCEAEGLNQSQNSIAQIRQEAQP